MKQLENKVAVVTGVGSGIGKAISLAFAKEGASLGVGDINDSLLSKTNEEIQKDTQNVIALNTDVSSEDQVKKLIDDTVNAYGKLDVIVNNVSVAIGGYPITDMSNEDWQKILAINFSSVFYGCKHSIPYLKKNNGGSIINLSSTAGIYGFPLRTPYAASKWAIIGVTKSLAMELGKFNIRVNAICPGTVSGDRINRVIEAKAKSLNIAINKVKEDFEEMVSLKTFVDKEDIANMAVFLLSSQAQKVSGQIMTVDGNTERMN